MNARIQLICYPSSSEQKEIEKRAKKIGLSVSKYLILKALDKI